MGAPKLPLITSVASVLGQSSHLLCWLVPVTHCQKTSLCNALAYMLCRAVLQMQFPVSTAELEAGHVNVTVELSARYGLPVDNNIAVSSRSATVRVEGVRALEVNIRLADDTRPWVQTAGETLAAFPKCGATYKHHQ